MKKKIVKREVLEDGSVIIGEHRRYKFTPYKENEKKKKFGIFYVDPMLLHPNITDKKLKEKERYKIYNDNFRYNGTNKGQYVLGIVTNSLPGLYKIKEGLEKLGYRKIKLVEECERDTEEILYSLDTVDSFPLAGYGNILTVQIKAIELDKLKEDLMKLRELIGYRCYWETENSFNSQRRGKRIRKTINIID